MSKNVQTYPTLLNYRMGLKSKKPKMMTDYRLFDGLKLFNIYLLICTVQALIVYN